MDNPIEMYADDSWLFDELYERLREAQKLHGKIVIGYDLDDTVRPFKSASCDGTIATILRCKQVLKPYFIVYTANTDMEFNYNYLKTKGLPYDAINDYPIDFPLKSFVDGQRAVEPRPKLYFNILLDDKTFGVYAACQALNKLCDEVESGAINDY